jgi:hypothetical protein
MLLHPMLRLIIIARTKAKTMAELREAFRFQPILEPIIPDTRPRNSLISKIFREKDSPRVVASLDVL